MLILQSTTNADGGTKQTNQGGDEPFTENTGQTDTSQSTGRDSNLEDGQHNDQQMGRDTDDVEQTQHAKEPSKETKGPGPQETMGHGPAQGSDVPPAQNHNGGPSPNQEPESKETRDPSPPPTHESGEPPSGNQEPESPGTQQPSSSQTQNPADRRPLEQNPGQQPREEGIPHEQSQLQTQNPVDTSLKQISDPQELQKESSQDQQESDQQSGQNDSEQRSTQEANSQENETKDNSQTDSTPPTEIKTTIVEPALKPEGEAPSVCDDIDSKDQPQNSEDEANVAYMDSMNPQADLTNTEETDMEPNKISLNNPESMEKNIEIPDTPTSPCETDPTTSHKFPNDQGGEKTKESEKVLEPYNEESDESSGEKNDKPADPSVLTEMTEQEGEDQTLQTKPDQEQGVSYKWF